MVKTKEEHVGLPIEKARKVLQRFDFAPNDESWLARFIATTAPAVSGMRLVSFGVATAHYAVERRSMLLCELKRPAKGCSIEKRAL